MRQLELGNKIAELRKKKGLTQEELVEKCKLNVRTLQRIESGEVNPRSYTVKIIFEALDFDINTVFPDDDIHAIRLNLLNEVKIHYKLLQEKLILTFTIMENKKPFFHHFFLSTGILWFICALSIVIFELNFHKKEILLTLIFPLAYAIFRQFDKTNPTKTE